MTSSGVLFEDLANMTTMYSQHSLQLSRSKLYGKFCFTDKKYRLENIRVFDFTKKLNL